MSPPPDYELKPDQVKVTIVGKVLDMGYARKVATLPDLRLEEIILLDKVAKGHSLACQPPGLFASAAAKVIFHFSDQTRFLLSRH